MSKYLPLIVFIFTLSLFYGCETDNNIITAKGSLQDQGITSYQYGTHILVNNKTRYALRSDNVELDSFINTTVRVKGKKVDGYPLEGGPILVEVLDIKKE